MRLLAYIPFRSVTIHTVAAGVYTSRAIADAHYTILDGSLIDALNTALAPDNWEAKVGLDGLVTIQRTAGADVIVWYNAVNNIDNTWLRDVLGFSGDTLAATGTAVRYSPYRLDVAGIAIDDVERPERVGFQAESDGGLYTLFHGTKRYRAITVPILGGPRGLELSEYVNAFDFAEFAALPGLAMRYYPDETISTAAYNRASIPWGYQVYSAQGSEFAPSQRNASFYGAWTWKLDLVPSTEPSDYHEV